MRSEGFLFLSGIWGRDRVCLGFGRAFANIPERPRACPLGSCHGDWGFVVRTSRVSWGFVTKVCRCVRVVELCRGDLWGVCLVIGSVLWCLVVSCRVASGRVGSRRVVSCRVASCRVASCHVTSRRVMSCPVTSGHVRRVLALHVLSGHVRRVLSLHVLSCHVTSCRVMFWG